MKYRGASSGWPKQISLRAMVSLRSVWNGEAMFPRGRENDFVFDWPPRRPTGPGVDARRTSERS